MCASHVYSKAVEVNVVLEIGTGGSVSLTFKETGIFFSKPRVRPSEQLAMRCGMPISYVRGERRSDERASARAGIAVGVAVRCRTGRPKLLRYVSFGPVRFITGYRHIAAAVATRQNATAKCQPTQHSTPVDTVA